MKIKTLSARDRQRKPTRRFKRRDKVPTWLRKERRRMIIWENCRVRSKGGLWNCRNGRWKNILISASDTWRRKMGRAKCKWRPARGNGRIWKGRDRRYRYFNSRVPPCHIDRWYGRSHWPWDGGTFHTPRCRGHDKIWHRRKWLGIGWDRTVLTRYRCRSSNVVALTNRETGFCWIEL